MNPTPATAHRAWFYAPEYRMPYGWSSAPPAPAAAAAEAAAAPLVGAHGMPPHGPMSYAHYQPSYRYMRRAMFRRGLFWFAIGAGATTWYFKHKERKQQRLEAFFGDRLATMNHLPPPPLAPQANTWHTSEPPSAPPQIPTDEHGRWGWSAWHQRHHQRHGGGMQSEASQENEKDMKETVEKLWAQRKEVQDRANIVAREYAKEKLDKLRLALDSLSESLNDTQGAPVTQKGKKLV